MKVSKDFILAVLFSEIGRLQKRAEEAPGSVREVSQKWLEGKKMFSVARALATWQHLINRAADLALGSDLVDTDRPRLDEDTGDSARPLVSLFSKVPLKTEAGDDKEKSLPEKAGFLPLYSPNNDLIYPVENLRVPGDAYRELWDRFNTAFTAAGPGLTPDTALVLLENYTACVPYLLPVGDDPRTDPFSDISLFDHLKMTAAIASCLYTYAMEQTDGREEEAAKFERSGDQAYLLVGGDFSGVQEFIYRISSKGALKAVRGRSFFLELLTQHVVAELLEATGCSRANVLYAAGAQFSLLLPNTSDACAKVTRIKREINSYLIQVHAGKLSLILEYLECSDANLLGKKKGGWSHVRAELGREIGKSKSRKFVEFFQHKEARDLQKEEVNCHCCGAVSPKGARGLMQVMPETAAEMGVSPRRLFDPQANVAAGTRYLAEQVDRFHGELPKALAAYNAGPGAVLSGQPLPRETRLYVPRVLARYRALKE